MECWSSLSSVARDPCANGGKREVSERWIRVKSKSGS